MTKLTLALFLVFVTTALSTAAAVTATLGTAGAAAAGVLAVTADQSASKVTTTSSLVWCRDVLPLGSYSDHYAKCAKVIGINPGSYLGIRTAPRYSATVVGRAYNGQWLEVDGCWVYGDGAADNPSYKVWAAIYSAGGYRYVSDWYLNSGNIRAQLPHC